MTIFFNQIQIAPLISDNLKPNRSLGESFYSFLNNNVVPLYIVHWLHLSCFYDNCVILDLQRLSNRRHTSCLLTFLKVTYEKLDLQVQLVWIGIHVLLFLWEWGKKLIAWSFWRQDHRTEHFWIKVFRSMILILQIKLLTFLLYNV